MQSFGVEHEEKTLEGWLESNPDGSCGSQWGPDIGRQVRTNFGGFIDLLGVDRAGDMVVVGIEARSVPAAETIAQSLEYHPLSSVWALASLRTSSARTWTSLQPGGAPPGVFRSG